MVCLLVFALSLSGISNPKVYDAGYWPQLVTSPDGKFCVRNYEGEGAVPYVAVFNVGKRRRRFATFADVTTFAWDGGNHALLVGTATMYGDGGVCEWNGERLPLDRDGNESGAKVIYSPPWKAESDEFETRILSVDSKTGTVRIRAARMDDDGDYTLSPRTVRVRYEHKRHATNLRKSAHA